MGNGLCGEKDNREVQQVEVVEPKPKPKEERREHHDKSVEPSAAFPLESMSSDLRASVIEKMMYPDFVNFNKCSTFSMEMCSTLPPNVKLPLIVEEMFINEGHEIIRQMNQNGQYDLNFDAEIIEVHIVKLPGWKMSHPLKEFPKSANYIVNILTIHPRQLEAIRNLSIEVEFIETVDTPVMEKAHAKELLQITKAKALKCDKEIDREALFLPEVQRLQFIECNKITDEDLLFLPIISINIRHADNLTSAAVHQLIQQWIAGKRRIADILLLDFGDFDLPTEELNKEPVIVSKHGSEEIKICKREDPEDFIKILHKNGLLCIRGSTHCKYSYVFE